MPTRSYKLYAATLTSGDNKNLIRIARKGTITSVSFSTSGIAGAGVDCNGAVEISFQSVSSFTTNDTPASVLAYQTFNAPISGGGFGGNGLIAGLSNPVNQGDQLYVHVVCFGTALASGRCYAIVTVNES